MSIDIIKEYLVEVSFSVDKPSFSQTEKTIQKLEGTLEKLFNSIAKLFKSFIDGIFENKHIRKPIEKVTSFFNKLAPKITTFLMTTRGLIIASAGAVVAAVVAGFAIITHQLHKFMSGVAQADMEIQKFARRMLTTVENARSLKAVMDAMGVQNLDELNDVAFNPELRSQFLALRGVASGLALGEDAQEGLKNIRAFNFEFQKLSLIVNYFFQQLAGHLGKVLGGPLQELKKFLDFNIEFFAKHAERFAKDIALFIGLFFKLLQIALKLSRILNIIKVDTKGFGDALSGVESVLNFFDKILNKINAFLDAIENFKFSSFKAGSNNDPIKRVADYVQKILNILEQFWNWAYKLLRDPFGFLAQKGKEFAQRALQGIANAVIPQAQASNSAPFGPRNTQAYKDFADKMADKYKINRNIFKRLINQESGWNPNARSPAGAEGIAQFMPATAKGMGVDTKDPYSSIEGAAKYIHNALIRYKGNYASALAAYNAGFGAVDKYRGVPPYKETQNYVNKIMDGQSVSQGITININGAGFNEEKLVATIKSQLQQAAGISTRMNQGAYV